MLGPKEYMVRYEPPNTGKMVLMEGTFLNQQKAEAVAYDMVLKGRADKAVVKVTYLDGVDFCSYLVSVIFRETEAEAKQRLIRGERASYKIVDDPISKVI